MKNYSSCSAVIGCGQLWGNSREFFIGIIDILDRSFSFSHHLTHVRSLSTMPNYTYLLATLALAVAATSSTASAAGPTKNIVELAQSVKDLSTLVTAVVAANLTSALEAKGPYTVFAPTNEAFAKLPAATLKRLLDPKNIKELQVR
jgi:uncharacterized surface protein with fasciclin (FAS1) repeats